MSVTRTKVISGKLTPEQIEYLNKIDKANKTNPLKLNQDMGREQFMNILMTQLANQNPLDPMQDKDFIAQIAQFSSVESMQALNKTFDSVKEDIAAIKTVIEKNSTATSDKEQKKLLTEINASIKEMKETQLKLLKKMLDKTKAQKAYD